MGFISIAYDDAFNLLQQTIKLKKNVIDVYMISSQSMSDAEKDGISKEIVHKMTCVMSDRAANMKLFNKQLHEWRQKVIHNEDINTHFLYCNAHFLLGLTTAAIKAWNNFIEEEGSSLARDKDQKFKRFVTSSEVPAFHIIRHVTEVLGPRGDEKNGCRQEWLNFCNVLQERSKFSSFRSNQFNNVLDNAFAVLYHHGHITNFS